jgi:hypothetical protein
MSRRCDRFRGTVPGRAPLSVLHRSGGHGVRRALAAAGALQLARDEEALLEGKATRITDGDGGTLTIDTTGVVRVVRIAVTLEDLSAVAPAVWRLQEAGLLPTDKQAPWARRPDAEA